MEKDDKPKVRKGQKKDLSLYDLIDPSLCPKYTEKAFLADIGFKENRINHIYLIQTWENNLIKKLGVEDHVAVRGLVNCTAKEFQEFMNYKNEQAKKKMLNNYSGLLPRYRLSQFLEYVDSLVDKKKRLKIQILVG